MPAAPWPCERADIDDLHRTRGRAGRIVAIDGQAEAQGFHSITQRQVLPLAAATK